MPKRPALLVQLGLLAALAAVAQLGPVYWPGAGFLLAAAATLPVAVASALVPHRCTWFFLATALVIGMIAVDEMYIFVAMTGPLGLALGLTADRPAWTGVALAAVTLTGGMLLLPLIAGVYPWGGIEQGLPLAVRAGAYAAFAAVYAGFWRTLLARVVRRLHLPI